MCNTEPTKLVDVFHHMRYSDRLKKLLVIVGLQESSRRYDIFKHFHSDDNCTLPKNFRFRNRPGRKHDYQLVRKAFKDGMRGLQTNFFYFQTIKTWNELPKEIAYAKSINSFKNKLDEVWKDLPIKLYEQERFTEA